MLNLPTIKFAVQIIAGLGVSKIVNDIISNNTTVVTTVDQVRVAVGSLVIGSMVADTLAKHVDTRVDEIAAWNEKRKAEQEKPEVEQANPETA